MTTARPMPWRLRTTASRLPRYTRAPLHPDRAGFADYAAGRMDRLGRDLLVQITRGPTAPAYRLENALLVSMPFDPALLIASVAWTCPDLVWIHATETIDADRAAPLLGASGRTVVVIDDDVSEAEGLGLLRSTG